MIAVGGCDGCHEARDEHQPMHWSRVVVNVSTRTGAREFETDRGEFFLCAKCFKTFWRAAPESP